MCIEDRDKSIHLVAVDMDGIFLDDENKYDRTRFARIHSRMQDDGIRFVVASDNQHRALSRCFDHHPDVFHIAGNGTLVAAGDEVLYTTPFAPADLNAAPSLNVGLPGVFVLVCYVSTAHASHISDPDVITALGRYYANLGLVDGWGRAEEPVLKLTLRCPGRKTAGLLEQLKAGLPAGAVPTPSGHGSIDIIPAGMNRGVALVWLGERIDVSLDDIAAFGDGGNDVKILERTDTGVAMDNAPGAVREISDDTTGSSNSQGVLAWLGDHLGLTN